MLYILSILFFGGRVDDIGDVGFVLAWVCLEEGGVLEVEGGHVFLPLA